MREVHIQICTYSNFVHNFTLFDQVRKYVLHQIYYNNRSKVGECVSFFNL